MREIYLDHNATTPIAPEVAAAMIEADRAGFGNPASSHAAGRRARRLLEDARETVGRILGADLTGMSADRIVFTSGGTEANNLAILGLAALSVGGWANLAQPPRPVASNATDDGDPRPRAIISAIEHPSVVGPAEHLAELGWRIDRLKVSSAGVANVGALDELLVDETRLVSVMLGNNETGVLQPVREIAAKCRMRGVLIHCDAVQVVGKLPVDFRSLGVDALSCSAHKFHGPRGLGALIVRSGVSIAPTLWGGFQQAGLRPGTEAVGLAVGMATALRLWESDADRRRRHLVELRDSFEAQLRAGWPELVVNGDAVQRQEPGERLPHTSNVSFLGVDRQALFMALDMAGIACSTGSACASGSNEPSPVLVAMGCDEAVIASSLRFSFGGTNTHDEIIEAVDRILKTVNDLRDKKIRGN